MKIAAISDSRVNIIQHCRRNGRKLPQDKKIPVYNSLTHATKTLCNVVTD